MRRGRRDGLRAELARKLQKTRAELVCSSPLGARAPEEQPEMAG